jgi:DNA-3-methyladenine glycosylase
MEEINSAWLARTAAEVAPDLLGCTLVREIAGDEYRGLIVETEAYDATDPACHGYKRQTDRNRAIFGNPGTIYVYMIYGIYHCLNIVCDRPDFCSAVLLRGVALDQVPAGIDTKQKAMRVGAGPGKLCRALQIDRSLNGRQLSPQSGLWLEPRSPQLDLEIVQTTRIGLTQGADTPWRWYMQNHPAVSKK